MYLIVLAAEAVDKLCVALLRQALTMVFL